MEDRVDAVYAWVDGSWPGYDEQLARHALRPVDRNPNRYRDNLDLLKYSLRSLEAFAPWLGHVHIVTARPQAPRWLDLKADGLRLVHHDAVAASRHLPTFSSFAIESHLYLLSGLSPRFLYLNDDMMLGRAVRPQDVMTADQRARIQFEWNRSRARPDDSHPWKAAIGTANRLLDEAFGRQDARRLVRHAPVLMDVQRWHELAERWPEALERTRASRFRSGDAFAPDYLYPHFCLETGSAVSVNATESYKSTAYVGLSNSSWLVAAQLAFVNRLRPRFLTLNDNFGEQPLEPVVARVRRFLDLWFPVPSRFEIQ